MLPGLTLAILTLAGCAHDPQPGKAFPSFAGRKATLGNVRLLGEVSVWHFVAGETNRVLLDETKALGSLVERRMRDALVAKGYRVDGSACVSTGVLLSRWMRSPNDTTAGPIDDPTEVFTTPFIRDNTLLRNPTVVNAWIGVVTQLSRLGFHPPTTRYEPRPGESPAYLPTAVTLCDSLGCDALAVLYVTCWEERRDPSRKLNAIQKLMDPIVFNPSATLELTLVDGRTGEVMWHDPEQMKGHYRATIEKIMVKTIEHLP